MPAPPSCGASLAGGAWPEKKFSGVRGWGAALCCPIAARGWGTWHLLENARNVEESLQGGETLPSEWRNLFDSPEGQNTPKSPPQNKAWLPGASPLRPPGR